MMQEIVAARIPAGGLEGEVTLRITGISREDADRWVRSREDLLGGRAELVSRWTAPDRVLEAAVQAPNADGLIKTLLRMGWTYAPSFERTIQTPAGSDPHPMFRCDVPETPFRRLLDQNTAHRIAHDMTRQLLEKEKARREAAEARVRDLEEDRKKNHQTIQAHEADYIRARNKARGVQDELDETRASLQEAEDHMRVLEMQYMKLHRKHWKAARVVGRYRRALESVVAENKRVRKDLRTLDPRSYYDDYIRAIEREETLEDGVKHLEAELEVEKDHVGILEQKNKDLIHQIAALQKQCEHLRQRRRQDLTFVLRDVNEAAGGVRAVSERINVLLAGKEPHPYKHDEDRKD